MEEEKDGETREPVFHEVCILESLADLCLDFNYTGYCCERLCMVAIIRATRRDMSEALVTIHETSLGRSRKFQAPQD